MVIRGQPRNAVGRRSQVETSAPRQAGGEGSKDHCYRSKGSSPRPVDLGRRFRGRSDREHHFDGSNTSAQRLTGPPIGSESHAPDLHVQAQLETSRYPIRGRYDAGARMGITDGAISLGMPSAFRILTRALPLGLVAALAAPAAALAAGSADSTGLPNVSLKVGNSTNNPGTTLTILGLLTLLTLAPVDPRHDDRVHADPDRAELRPQRARHAERCRRTRCSSGSRCSSRSS